MVQPIILTPSYPAWPMGHATEAYTFAKIICALTGQAGSPMAQQLQVIARRIADNRVITGVHFPIDSTAGFVLAEAMSDYFIARCTSVAGTPTEEVAPVKLDSALLSGSADGDPSAAFENDSPWNETAGAPAATRQAALKIVRSKILACLWERSTSELQAHGWA